MRWHVAGFVGAGYSFQRSHLSTTSNSEHLGKPSWFGRTFLSSKKRIVWGGRGKRTNNSHGTQRTPYNNRCARIYSCVRDHGWCLEDAVSQGITDVMTPYGRVIQKIPHQCHNLGGQLFRHMAGDLHVNTAISAYRIRCQRGRR